MLSNWLGLNILFLFIIFIIITLFYFWIHPWGSLWLRPTPPLYVTCSFLNLNWEMIYSTHLLRCVNINHQSHFVDNSTLQMFTYLFELTLAHVTGTPLLIRMSNTSNTVTVIVTNNAIYWYFPPPWRGVVLIPVNIPMLLSFSMPIGQYTDIVVLFHTYRSIYRYCRHFPCTSVNIPILLSFSMPSVNIPILPSFPCLSVDIPILSSFPCLSVNIYTDFTSFYLSVYPCHSGRM